MAMTPAEAGETYFSAWERGDFGTLRSVLADDVTFAGPLGTAANADQCIEGLKRMSEIMTGLVVTKTFIDGPDVLTWFELHTARTGPIPVVNWRTVRDGKITSIRVTFDPRALTGA